MTFSLLFDNGRPTVRSTCLRCGFPIALELTGNADADHRAHERWLATPCPHCETIPSQVATTTTEEEFLLRS